MAYDPSVARQGTALLVEADGSRLASNGLSAESISFALPRGTRIDSTARDPLCTRAQAASSACPAGTRIGFGRFIVVVRNFAWWGGQAQLVWSIDASLGQPLRRGDAASVVLTSKLLGADSVAALLAPALGTSVPSTVTTAGRLVRRASGEYGVELDFAQLPVQFDVPAPATASPVWLELALSAVRRTRRDFIRRVRVRTLSGYEVRKIRDHRLIGHHLLRTPSSCSGSWPAELRVGFPDGIKRSDSPIACTRR